MRARRQHLYTLDWHAHARERLVVHGRGQERRQIQGCMQEFSIGLDAEDRTAGKHRT